MKPFSVISGNHVPLEKKELARRFRQEATLNEAAVWEWLRNKRMMGLKWRRQQVIEGFIADFYCAQYHIALEIDGEIHDTKRVKEYDIERDAVFAQKGIQTIRISNSSCTRDNLENLIKATLHGESCLKR